MTSILSFPMDPDYALALIRDAVAAGRVVIPDPPEGGEWYRVVTRRQVSLCLREGDMVGNPEVDPQGNVNCRLERFSAGGVVRVRVALVKDDSDWWRVMVLTVENRL